MTASVNAAYNNWVGAVTTAETTTGYYSGPPTTGYCYTYPSWWPYNSYSNHTQKAFQIAKRLIASKKVQAKTVDQFIELVDLIEKELV